MSTAVGELVGAGELGESIDGASVGDAWPTPMSAAVGERVGAGIVDGAGVGDAEGTSVGAVEGSSMVGAAVVGSEVGANVVLAKRDAQFVPLMLVSLSGTAVSLVVTWSRGG